MTKHTPGPWTYEYSNSDCGDGEWYEIEHETESLLCWSYHDPESCRATAEANARLMAASPVLLEAARLALQNYERNLLSEDLCGQPFMGDDEHEVIAALTAAIATATGEKE